MGEPASRRPTYADVLDAPEGMTAEILDGELYLSPRPATDHAAVGGDLFGDLREQFGRRRDGSGPGGWWLLREPELHLGTLDPHDVIAAPDIAGWRRERLPQIPRAPAITLAPDWVCEILSPGPRNTRRDTRYCVNNSGDKFYGNKYTVKPDPAAVADFTGREIRETITGTVHDCEDQYQAAQLPPSQCANFFPRCDD